MSMNVVGSLKCGTVDGTNNGSSDATEQCYCEPGSPVITYSITD